MELRDYQQACLDTLAQKYLIEDKRRLLMVIPTAGGKTVVFAQLPEYFPGEQMLVIEHRTELVQQAAAKLRTVNPTLRVAVEQAESKARPDADIIVASVQTLAREARRKKFVEHSKFGLVVIDECHHLGKGNTYHQILSDLGVMNGGPRLLGVTATPYRTSGESLAMFFEEVGYEVSLLDLMNQGWLSPLRAFQVRTNTSLDDVHTKAGDFAEGELAAAVDTETRNIEIVRSWQKLASERRSTLVFAVNVQHAKDLLASFRAAEIPSELVLGETDAEERAQTLRRFVTGDFKVLVNVGIATEGVDIPPIDTIVLARPTKSKLLITQMIGRGLRLSPETGKDSCLVIDLVDNTTRHSLATAATVLGLPEKTNPKGRDLREVKQAVEKFSEEFPGFDLGSASEVSVEWLEDKRREMRDLMARSSTRVDATEISLFGRPDPAVRKVSGLTWIRTFDGSLRLRIPPAEKGDPAQWVEIRRDASDHYRASCPDGSTLGPFASEADALRAGDVKIRSDYGDRLTLIRSKAAWHRYPASDKQRALIRKLGSVDPPVLTKGEAGRLIDSLSALRESASQGPCTSKQAWYLKRMGLNPASISKQEASRIIGRSKTA